MAKVTKTNHIDKFRNDWQYKLGRYALLAITVMTLINLFLITLFNYHTFTFGRLTVSFYSWVTYVISLVGNAYFTRRILFKFIVTFIIGLASVAVYAIPFYFAKRNMYWMIGSMGIFLFDTVMHTIETLQRFLLGDYSFIANFFFHIVALSFVILASAHGIVATVQNNVQAIDLKGAGGASAEGYTEENKGLERTITVYRDFKKHKIDRNIIFVCLASGKMMAEVKNGQSVTFTLDANPHNLHVIDTMEMFSTTVKLPAGSENLKFHLKLKKKLTTIKVIMEKETL